MRLRAWFVLGYASHLVCLGAMVIHLTLLAPTDVLAQPAATALSGVVTDPMQGLVAGVTVVLIDAEGKEQRKGRSDKAGRFELKAAPDGRYVVEARQVGFKTARAAIALFGGAVRQDIALEIGGITETDVVNIYQTTETPPERHTISLPPHKCRHTFVAGGIGGKIEAPMKIRHAVARYPEALKAAKLSGEALVEGVVGTDGHVKNLRVVGATHPDFGSAALQAVAEWRFDPPRLNCVPVETKIEARVVFDRRMILR